MKPTNLQIGLGVSVLVGLLVIFSPSLFTTDLGGSIETKVLELRSKMTEHRFEEEIQLTRRTIVRDREEVRKLRKQAPWLGQTPLPLTAAIHDAEDQLQATERRLTAVVDAREGMLTQIRALTPVFSELAWEETRDLFASRQESYAGTSFTLWQYDMMFSLIFGGLDREGNFLAQVVGAVIQLVMRLTFGSVAALVDFAVRLPFWLREYQLVEDDSQEIALLLGEESTGYAAMYERAEGQSTRSVGRGGSWKSTVAAFVFYALAMSGAVVATGLILLLIWSPLIALGIFLVYKGSQSVQQRRAASQTGAPPRGYRLDADHVD